MGKDVETEVTPLELALAQVPPFGKGDGLAVMAAHVERIAVYKAPQTVEFVSELPKSATGKILKRVLRAQ